MKLEGKTIVVTGANRGIGEAVVRELLKHKVAKVYAAARKPQDLPDFGDKRAVALPLDITDAKQIAAAASLAKDANVLINNAGVASFASLFDGERERLAGDMAVNYFGTVDVMRAFAPVLQKNGKGLIANVASVVSLAPMTAIAGYSASKAALHSATVAARTELAARGIHVAGIYPGPIDTDMARSFEMEKATPAATAKAIVAGLIAGDDYIFPDPYSAEAGPLWLRDPRALERQFSGGKAESEAA
jgi:NAD(P)-dependent dehydrogenase (short-subunit alcohol dehydrogenase family)